MELIDYGDGYGYGSGSGSGSGYGSVSGYGSGYGDGEGYGEGYGSGDGFGYGDGYEISVPERSSWFALHCIVKTGSDYRLRDGRIITTGCKLEEKEIAMCEKGLHASFSKEDAMKYAPKDAVLTKVAVWGRILVGKDKLVATNRMLMEEVK